VLSTKLCKMAPSMLLLKTIQMDRSRQHLILATSRPWMKFPTLLPRHLPMHLPRQETYPSPGPPTDHLLAPNPTRTPRPPPPRLSLKTGFRFKNEIMGLGEIAYLSSVKKNSGLAKNTGSAKIKIRNSVPRDPAKVNRVLAVRDYAKVYSFGWRWAITLCY
jgi:hypothetical protein